jgi:hypothetical protein
MRDVHPTEDPYMRRIPALASPSYSYSVLSRFKPIITAVQTIISQVYQHFFFLEICILVVRYAVSYL